MVRKVDEVWSRWGLHNDKISLDWAIIRVVPGLRTTTCIKFIKAWIIIQSFTRESFNGERTNGDKKSKQRMTVMLIVTSDGSFVFEPTAISRSKRPPCFVSLKNPLKPMSQTSLESILSRLDRKMCLEKLKFVLSWDNATCFPETLQENLTNIKLVFLPKNKTSWLQPLDAGIIRSFKNKYRNLLVCYVVSLINEEKTVSQIIEDVHVLKAITWLQTGRKSVSTETIK